MSPSISASVSPEQLLEMSSCDLVRYSAVLISIGSSGATLSSSPAAPPQPVQLNLQTYLAAVQSRPTPAVGAFVADYHCCNTRRVQNV